MWTQGCPKGQSWAFYFCLYINDLPDNVKSHVRLFADDCLLYRPIKAVADQIDLQQDLHALTLWAESWEMKFNPSKCYIMSTCQSTKIGPYLYSLCGCVLSKVTNSKYIGVTISEDLQWNTHITDTSAKASRTLGFLRRNLRGCPKELKQLAYFSLKYVPNWNMRALYGIPTSLGIRTSSTKCTGDSSVMTSKGSSVA